MSYSFPSYFAADGTHFYLDFVSMAVCIWRFPMAFNLLSFRVAELTGLVRDTARKNDQMFSKSTNVQLSGVS